MLPELEEEVRLEQSAQGLLEDHRDFTNRAANLIDKKLKVVIAVICLEDGRYNLALLPVEIAMLAEIVGVISEVDAGVELQKVVVEDFSEFRRHVGVDVLQHLFDIVALVRDHTRLSVALIAVHSVEVVYPVAFQRVEQAHALAVGQDQHAGKQLHVVVYLHMVPEEVLVQHGCNQGW
jgi:hypothetical protein